MADVSTKILKRNNLKKEDISAIAFTKGPGLLGSLLVGSSFAKSFAMGMLKNTGTQHRLLFLCFYMTMNPN